MFTGLHLQNYGTFVAIDWELMDRDESKRVVALYGENGAGKTQLLRPFAQLSASVGTLRALQQLMSGRHEAQAVALDQLFADSFTIGRKKDAVIRVDFDNHALNQRTGSTGYYELIFDADHRLKQETLYSVINVRNGILFQVTRTGETIHAQLNDTTFPDARFNHELDTKIQQWWGKHTLLSIIDMAASDLNQAFLDARIQKSVWHVITALREMSYTFSDRQQALPHKHLLTSLGEGVIDSQHAAVLDATEQTLNAFFPQLYSDINALRYERFVQPEGIHYRLLVQKNIWGTIVELPFALESDGTKRLLALIPMLADAMNGKTVVIDEVDSGIHDLLILKLIKAINAQVTGQVIFSTHNTMLMNALKPTSVYVIQEATSGEKFVSSIAEIRAIKPHNNMQKMYLNGDFMGIPYTGFLDLGEVFHGQGE